MGGTEKQSQPREGILWENHFWFLQEGGKCDKEQKDEKDMKDPVE